MNYEEFLGHARSQGFEEKDETLWGVTKATTGLEVEYDDDDRPTHIVETDGDFEGSDETCFFIDPAPIDADFHFEARIIGSVESDEFILIDEEGPYHGHVFINMHDQGMSTVVDLIDAELFDASLLNAYGDEDYEDVSPKTRLEWQPFFQNPVARSLKEFAERLTKA
ncbi:MAG: hypothetical protein ACI9KE_002887 [Polyangiales bacterium]|jgi:hypothetical protein